MSATLTARDVGDPNPAKSPAPVWRAAGALQRYPHPSSAPGGGRNRGNPSQCGGQMVDAPVCLSAGLLLDRLGMLYGVRSNKPVHIHGVPHDSPRFSQSAHVCFLVDCALRASVFGQLPKLATVANMVATGFRSSPSRSTSVDDTCASKLPSRNPSPKPNPIPIST
eukprot:CAMPEP_0119401598 /NCGR_PEP_ID=MMETSP1334-20130426/142454_1 /TAXON_ID=127549 /ORGANISM="Calcidiscus leptoporus, Strain RCC1130" /LENGTH=165 /DNA_ID=CAMNT_0007425517 /DNA_START=247 /DNA_END=745 /DNA_ORIENTATION=-